MLKQIKFEELKKEIFKYDLIKPELENDEIGFVLLVKEKGEFILSRELTKGKISYYKAKQLMRKLLAEYGYHYPINIIDGVRYVKVV